MIIFLQRVEVKGPVPPTGQILQTLNGRATVFFSWWYHYSLVSAAGVRLTIQPICYVGRLYCVECMIAFAPTT